MAGAGYGGFMLADSLVDAGRKVRDVRVLGSSVEAKGPALASDRDAGLERGGDQARLAADAGGKVGHVLSGKGGPAEAPQGMKVSAGVKEATGRLAALTRTTTFRPKPDVGL